MTSSTNLHVCLISSYFTHFNIKCYSSSTSLLSPCVLMKDHRDHRAAQYIPGDEYGYLLYAGCQVSSIWGRTKPHLRWWSYRKWCHVTGSHRTGSDVTEVCSAHARIFPALFSSYSRLVHNVVQVTWLPEVTPLGFPWVCACATGSCTISTLMGHFDGSDDMKRHLVVTKGHVAPSGELRACVIGSALGMFSMTPASIFFSPLSISAPFPPFY